MIAWYILLKLFFIVAKIKDQEMNDKRKGAGFDTTNMKKQGISDKLLQKLRQMASQRKTKPKPQRKKDEL